MGLDSLLKFVHQASRLGVLWEPGRAVLFPEWVFYVGGNAPFEDSLFLSPAREHRFCRPQALHIPAAQN